MNNDTISELNNLLNKFAMAVTERSLLTVAFLDDESSYEKYRKIFQKKLDDARLEVIRFCESRMQ